MCQQPRPAVLKVVLVVVALLQLSTCESSTNNEDVTLPMDATTQPYLFVDTAIDSAPSDDDNASSEAVPPINDSLDSFFEDTTESPSSVRRVRQALTSEEMTRMRPPPPPRGSPLPFRLQTTPPILVPPIRQNTRPPPPFPPRPFSARPPPGARIPSPQPFSIQTGFNPSLFTANPFTSSYNIFTTNFDPNRQRSPEFQGQFGPISQNSVIQDTQPSAVQAVLGFPQGRFQNFQDLNSVVRIVQGPITNPQQVALNTVHPLLQNDAPIPTSNGLPLQTNVPAILNPANHQLRNQINFHQVVRQGQSLGNGSENHVTEQTNDLQQSASSHPSVPAQSINEVQDFSTLLNTAPHLQAAFGGGGNHPSVATPTASQPIARKKATLKEILAEDCPLASKMGYCPSPPRYPAHQVGVITRQCEHIMEALYAPLPVEETVVSTTLRSAILSSTNASDMERGNRQIWSWARYSQDKSDVDMEQNTLCSSGRREMEPGYARDMNSGRWFVVIQANNRYSQRVMVDKCTNEGEPCSGLKGAHCTGFRTRFKQTQCVQRYSYVSLITWDPDQPLQCPKMRLFKFPTACVCQLN